MLPTKFNKLSSATKLSLLSIVVLLVGTVFSVNYAMQSQQSQTNAWLTSQSAKAVCGGLGTEVQVSFTNTETNTSLGMNVVAQDVTTGVKVNLGTIGAQQTKTGVINTTRSSLPSGGVVFNLSWSSGASGTDQRSVAYTGITCTAPAGLAVVSPACINSEYDGTGVHLLWSDTKVQAVDISADSAFATFYNRAVGGTTSTTGPSGFALYGGRFAI